MTTPARARYGGYRFPAEIIGHALWLYFRFPLGLRMVEELLAARGIIVSHETVRQWARKFGQQFANQIRRRLPRVGDDGDDASPKPSIFRHEFVPPSIKTSSHRDSKQTSGTASIRELIYVKAVALNVLRWPAVFALAPLQSAVLRRLRRLQRAYT